MPQPGTVREANLLRAPAPVEPGAYDVAPWRHLVYGTVTTIAPTR